LPGLLFIYTVLIFKEIDMSKTDLRQHYRPRHIPLWLARVWGWF
jgi:hypothetical protein